VRSVVHFRGGAAYRAILIREVELAQTTAEYSDGPCVCDQQVPGSTWVLPAG